MTVLVAAPPTSAMVWQPAVEVTDAPAAAIRSLASATSPDGAFVVAWAESPDGRETSWSVQVATRAPGAAEFSAPITAAPAGGLVPEVALVVDGAGTTTVAWRRLGPNGNLVEAARRPAGATSFAEPERVAALATSGVSSLAAVGDERGRVTLLVSQHGPSAITSVTWEPVVTAWADPDVLEARAGVLVGNEPSLGVDGAGRVTATWSWATSSDSTEFTVQSRTRSPGDDAFGGLQTHSGAGRLALDPQTASNAGGETVLAWWEYVDDRMVLMASDRAPGDTVFGDPARAATLAPDAGANQPAVVVDSAGNVTMAWAQQGDARGGWVTTRAAGQDEFTPPIMVAPGPTGDVALGTSAGSRTVGAAALLTWIGRSGALGGSPVARAAYRPPGGVFGQPMALSGGLTGIGDTLVAGAVDDTGDAQVALTRLDSTVAVGNRVYARVLDATGPRLEVAVPATGTSGAAVAMSATARDRWSGPPTIRWELGDGTTATGASVSHVYAAAAGTYAVRVTATDVAGNATTRTATITVSPPSAAVHDVTAPVLTGARLRPRDLPTGVGARLRLTSSENAALAGVVQRKRDGRWRAMGTKRWSLRAGANTRTFYGKTSEQRLRSGRYRVLLTATDAAGNASATTTIRFRVDRG